MTRGKGVAIHRSRCSNFRQMLRANPRACDRRGVGHPAGGKSAVYPVDVAVEAADRQGLLRDISELFAKEKHERDGGEHAVGQGADGSLVTFDGRGRRRGAPAKVLAQVARVPGVRAARRR